MPEISQSRLWLLAGAVAATLSLGACSSFTERSRTALSAITPYKVEVVQGNFVSKEQVELLKPGMPRQQVREILGTSLLTIRRQGVEPQQRRLTLFFNGELLDRFEGDPMPSEQEFVAAVDARGRAGKVPVLEATEDQLKKFEPGKDKGKEAEAESSSASLPPLPPSYPPLEATR
jgi:outer membrane protein assembly factor BamE